MSVVTGVLLITSVVEEGDALREVEQWVSERHPGDALRAVEDHVGGRKHPQFIAMGAGINYFLDVDEFAEFVLSREWQSPENIVLVLQPEEGPTRVCRPGSWE